MLAVIDAYIRILTPFKEATIAAQGSTHPTLPAAARFLLPLLNEVPGNLLGQDSTDGALQKEIKAKMLGKLQSYYGMAECDLLYAAAFLDPLHVCKISSLGSTDMGRRRGMDYLENKLDALLVADKVLHVPLDTHPDDAGPSSP